MQHAQLIQVEVRKCSTKSDQDEGESLEEGAVLHLLEQDHDLNGDSDAITGTHNGLVLGAVLWIVVLSVIALIL